MQAVGWNAQVDSSIITGAYLCCECGLCGALFACPLLLSPDRYNGELKKKLRANGVSNPHRNRIERPRTDRETRLISVELLTRRLGLCDYDMPSPLAAERLNPARVRIALDEHIGEAARPIVRTGQPVEIGQLIAETPSEALGTTVHASLAGVVTGVDERFIQITARKPS
jgi:Na+-translocating ferredoxin:NAD+ oxidoreductase RnfC subunit